MAKRGRPPKTQDLTIQSRETKVFVALVLLTISILLIGSSYFEGEFFLYITQYLGRTAFILGIVLAGLSLKLFGYDIWLTKPSTLVGMLIAYLSILPFAHFTIPIDQCEAYAMDGEGGGMIGCAIHNALYNWFDKGGELVVLVTILIIGISITTGTSPKQYITFIEVSFKKLFSWTQNVKTKLETVKQQQAEANAVNEQTIETRSLDLESEPAEIKADQPQSKEPVESQPARDESQPKQSGPSDESDILLLYPNWVKPPISLLDPKPPRKHSNISNEEQARLIEQTLKSFNITAQVVNINRGPTVVQYALKVSMGTKVTKISNLSKDIATVLAAPSGSVRIQTPIPGTSLVGIEVPHDAPDAVVLREILTSKEAKEHKFALPMFIGKSVTGDNIVYDLAKMPHLLIAGATGSGKSVSINAFIMGLTMNLSPDEMRLILVDPKTVEFAPYADIPHLLVPVVTEVEKVVSVLTWSVEEMQTRYHKLKDAGVRNIKEYNEKQGWSEMPYIVIIIDEMADLMLTTGVEVENKIVRLAQMARAVGLHLILATQRPSVNVITGLIKANIPARIAMTVSTGIDSRVILDQTGAEDLLGRGDMLFKAPDKSHVARIQGIYCTNQEIEHVVDFLKTQGEPCYQSDVLTASSGYGLEINNNSSMTAEALTDKTFLDSIRSVVSSQKASASYLQRKFRIGYNKAARYIDIMQELKIIGPQEGSRAREVLITNADEFIEKLKSE